MSCSKPRLLGWDDEKRLRYLGEHAHLPAHVRTNIRKLVLAEMVELGLIKFDEAYALRKNMYSAQWKLQFKEHQKRELENLHKVDASLRPPMPRPAPVPEATPAEHIPVRHNRSRLCRLLSLLRPRGGSH